MPTHERFFYDPHITETGGVRWLNEVIVECDRETGRAIVRALNAAMMVEKHSEASTYFDVTGDILDGKPVVNLDFSNGRLLCGATLDRKQSDQLMRQIKTETAHAVAALRHQKKGKR